VPIYGESAEGYFRIFDCGFFALLTGGTGVDELVYCCIDARPVEVLFDCALHALDSWVL
jgi:hypothetical protein